MRMIIGITLLIVGLGLLLSKVEGVELEAPSAAVDADWVRTSDGWQHPSDWQVKPVDPPRLHPLVVAAGQGLASLLALVAGASARPVDIRRLWQLARTGQ